MLIKLIITVVGYCFGVYFFCRGFLLTRQSLRMRSSCDEVQHPSTPNGSLPSSASNGSGGGCWVPVTYRKSILLVVDALRYDFVAKKRHGQRRVYHNRFTNVQRMLTNSSGQSMLFKFVADPPTTTLQRLKGVTTGNLPTFIDAGSNFAGSAIDEDNVIDQLVVAGKRLTFMGDDTWMTLFPDQFRRSFPFPSFDVHDLHTVDDGVLRHLYSEMKRCDWDVLIAHFLGVDHCGHKYGPNHPEMAKKLTQIDQAIKNVTELMDDDTILFVFGDHGMTETGDHGGDSDDELGAALFVYGKSEIHREKQNAMHTAAQVSIAPTLALLMDVPVPYSNLGALLPQLFTNPDVRLQAARVNVHQVMRYAETYLRNFHDAVLAERISPLLKVFNGLDSEELTVEKSVEMIHRVGAIFQDGWAKYHVGWMLLGILALFENLLSSLVMIRNQRHRGSGRVILLKAISMCLSVWATLARNESIPPVVGITLGVEMTMHVHCLLTDLLTSDRLCSFTDLLSLLLVLVHAALVFSNSYIVHEQVVAQHFMAAYFVLLIFGSMRSKVKADRTLATSRHRRRLRVTWFAALKKPSISSTLSLLGALLLLRCGVQFYRCREEIMNCVMPVFLLPFGSLLESDQRLIRSSTAALGLFMLYWLPYVFGRFVGLFPSNGLRAFLVRCCLRCVSMCTFLSWSYSWLVELYPKLMDTSVKLFFPRVFYAAILMFFFIYLFDPCFVRAVASGKRNDLLLLPKIEQNIISSLRCKVQIDPCYSHVTLSLYGGRCAMVSSLALLLWMLTLAMAMLLGDGLSLSVACFVLLIGIVLGHNYADSASISKTILLAEMANYYFYAFGHHTTFTAIPWDAAFIGIPGNHGNMWLQAALVVVNISASHILACFVLPLMACWKPCYNDKRPVSTLFQTGLQQASANVFHYSMLFLSVMGVRLLFCTAACAMHRRHLMTWKIFAPKFIFEGVLFLVVCCCLIVQYALTLYVRNRLLRLFDFCCSDIMRIRFY